MRVMVIVKATKESEAGVLPSGKLLAEMGKFNEELSKAGVMLAGDGLRPSSKGVRVRFLSGGTRVTEGPFPHAGDLVAGFWVWQVGSREEAVDWLMKAPFEDAEVEIRPLHEAEDFASVDPGPEGRRRKAA